MNDHLCMGCMSEKGEEDVCSFCGYADGTPQFPSYLETGSIVDNRYLIGKVLFYNGESVTYIGYDVIAKRRVKVREYFPDTLALRGDNGKTVAVKPGSQIQFKAYMSDFIEIAEKISRMRTFSCIVQVLAICYQNNTVYSVLEYVEGMSLKTYLEKRGVMLTWTETAEMLMPLIQTLEMVHEDGLIHRGISSDTVTLCRNKSVKLNGFAISAVRASQTELVEELFPGFSAPEQYSTVSPHGPWTDVYAVCALLYNCVTAQPPTEALVRSASKPLMSPRERNETVPPRVSQAIMQGLSLSTTDRIQNIGELLKRIGGPFQSTAAGNDAPTVSIASMKAQSAVLRMTETFDKSEEEDVDPAKPRSKRLVLWSMGVTLPILLAILIFTFWFLFGKSRDPQPPEDSSSIVDSMFGDFSDASSNRYESSSGDSFDSSTDPSDSSNEEEKSQMDNLVGMSYEAVVANAGYREKYIFNPPQYAYNEQYEAGVIFEQNIESGALVEKNASIQLKVSKGSAYVMIPSYEKMTETDYVAKLRQLGINCTVIYRSDESYPEGYVVGMDVMAGTKYNLETGETIEVYVNKAPPAKTVQ